MEVQIIQGVTVLFQFERNESKQRLQGVETVSEGDVAASEVSTDS